MTTADGEAHELGNKKTVELSMDYLEETIPIRLDVARPSNNLENTQAREGIFLHLENGSLVKGDDRNAERNSLYNWLPSRKIANSILTSIRHSPKKK